MGILVIHPPTIDGWVCCPTCKGPLIDIREKVKELNAADLVVECSRDEGKQPLECKCGQVWHYMFYKQDLTVEFIPADQLK